MSSLAGEPELAPRLRRLRDELVEDLVPLPVDGDDGARLLAELSYARQPPVHEGRAPLYGSLVVSAAEPISLPEGALVVGPPSPGRVPDPTTVRQAADGRAVFVISRPEAEPTLACFEHTVEYEASLVRLQADTGAFVVQRTAAGVVRVCTAEGVITWDGIRWTFKPGGERYAMPLLGLLPAAPMEVRDALLELCVHWRSAGRVGATLVWELGGVSVRRIDAATAEVPPPLSITERRHFGGWLSLLGQLDRAVVVDAEGDLRALGVALAPSDEARALLDPMGGTRHTSARQFSYDEPGAVVLVVSEDGPVTVFAGGAVAATIRTDPCRSGFPTELLEPTEVHPDDQRTAECPHCHRELLVDVVLFDAWEGVPERLDCPVCDHTIEVDAYRAAVRGVITGAGTVSG